MKGLSLGRQHFEFFHSKNLIYVDKTPLIYQLVQEGSVYFLSRPRRFGKSLTVDILKNIYLGNQYLFEGYWIYDKIEWKEHPIIHIDFSQLSYHTIGLEASLVSELKIIAGQYDLSINGVDSKSMLRDLILKLSPKGKIALLIDEYDKPITDHITNLKKANENRKVLRNFYSGLKGLGNQFSIIFITGIAKFAKVSLFSVLNHFTDLSLQEKYASLTGITQEELLHYFGAYLDKVAIKYRMSQTELLTEIKKKYNGYSWDGKTFVYNPFSLLNFFNEGRFKNYWINTGTPKFLVDLLRVQKAKPEKLVNKKVEDTFFESFDIRTSIIPVPLVLFQSGYLTVRNITYTKRGERYELGYPNEEVEQAFMQNLIEAYTFKNPTIVNTAIIALEDAFIDRDIEEIHAQLNVLLSDISHLLFPFEKKAPAPSRLQQEFLAWEGYFHTIIYLVLQYLGIQIGVEVSKHKGGIDAIIEVDEFIYVTEFKLEDAKVALQQIKEQKYAHSYYNSSKEVILMGIAFEQKKREVKDIEWEVWDRTMG